MKTLLGLLALSLTACALPATNTDQESSSQSSISQNPDRQSDEEIAVAHATVLRDFGHLDRGDTRGAALPPGYGHLDPQHLVPQNLLVTAVTYFDQNKDSFPNKGFVTIVDFTPRSDKVRLFLVNLTDGSVERYHTTHGEGSDADDDGYAESFGNVEGSMKSSLGFVRTAEVYSGTYQRSIRLDGLSTTNSNMRSRAIVFHGWDGVKEANVKQGLSEGCITLDWTVKDAVVDKIKEGSLIYAGLSN